MTTCDRCCQPIGDNGVWPGDNGEVICLECWEAQCSASWWAAVTREESEARQ